MARLIGIFGGKGGVGKTTVAINLACALGLLNKKVSLVDLNFTTSHLAVKLGIIPHITLNHALKNEVNIKSALYSCFNIHVLPASLNLSELSNIGLLGLKPRIKDLLKDFEIVLLDSAPGFGKEALLAMKASDDIILVVTPTTAAVTDIIKCKNLAIRLGVNPLGIVVNKYKNRKFQLRPEEIVNLTGLPLLAVIREDENFLKSEAARIPLIFYKRNKAEEFLKLACSLTGKEYREPSFFDRLLGKSRYVEERILNNYSPVKAN
ncbi:MAG: MinD/ParA family ATP-binding protein [Candidatus Heimdallarchaeaceae archaeon]